MTRPTAFSPQITQAQFPAIAAHHITHSATATPTTELIFGQGFRQTISLFHAPFYKRWDVEWRYLSSDTLSALTEFLAEQGGLSAFLWSPDGTSYYQVRCQSWSERADHNGAWHLSCRFTSLTRYAQTIPDKVTLADG